MVWQACLMRSVSLSSSLLGCMFPEGWLWQKAMAVALQSSAARTMTLTSTAVSVIPPLEMRSALMSLQAWFIRSTHASSLVRSCILGRM